MIGKSRREFLIISMSVLLVTFAILFFGFYSVSHNNFNKMIARELSYTQETFVTTKEVQRKNCFVVEIVGQNENRYVKSYNADYFSESTVDTIIEIATSRHYEYGNVNDVYYKITSGENPLIIAMDSTDLSLMMKSNLLTALIVLLGAFSAVFIVILLTSSRFVKPINETLNRQLQFISNASHELKTPIAIISANSQVLKNIDNNKWVNNIQTQTERMQVLVNDMLTLAKIDEGNAPLLKEKFNLSETIVACSLPFDAVAFEKNCFISLNVEDNVEYDGSLESIKVILNVLLDNAVKYTPKGGEINITLKNDARPTIVVENTGSLILDQESNKIFERFYRGDNSRSRETGGSGLGLAIAKSVADANKWKISAKSVYGKSMTITLQM
ncbi:MAG: hypothetical protein J6R83_01735 [Clostridia bacterium]|nr:hypothetical protein [Clostridia bacterium]